MENGSIRAEKKIIRNRRIILTAAVLAIFLVWNTDGLFPKPWGIPAMLMVPVVISIGMFERETAGMFFGLFAGIFGRLAIFYLTFRKALVNKGGIAVINYLYKS